MIRENADLGFCADAAVVSGFMGMIRENVDLGFCVDAAAGSGFMGMIRENADLGFGADAAAASGFIAAPHVSRGPREGRTGQNPGACAVAGASTVDAHGGWAGRAGWRARRGRE